MGMGFGVVRCGGMGCGAVVVWCGVVWCVVAWCDVVRCGLVWCGVVRVVLFSLSFARSFHICRCVFFVLRCP